MFTYIANISFVIRYVYTRVTWWKLEVLNKINKKASSQAKENVKLSQEEHLFCLSQCFGQWQQKFHFVAIMI